MKVPGVAEIQTLLDEKLSRRLGPIPTDLTSIVNGPDGPISVIMLTERERQIMRFGLSLALRVIKFTSKATSL
jgi:hypothetical protein